MPDYASILRRSVTALPDPSPEMREAVYQRARAALARQLTAVEPPLSTREIESQHQELEDAVGRLETEFGEPEAPAPAFGGGSQHRDEFLYSAPQTTVAQPKHSPAPEPSDDLEDLSAFGSNDEDDDDFSEEDEDEQSSRAPLLVGLVLVLLVIVGAGAFAFAQRGTILGFFGFGGETDVAATDTGSPTDSLDDADGPDKRADRLTNGSEASPVEDLAVIAPPAAEEGATVPEVSPSAAETGSEQQSAALEPGTSLVEQRAIYYYQGPEGSPGEASEGTVTWTEIMKDDRPAIQALLKIAEPDVTASVTIYKNFDGALPASHLVEIQFDGGLGENPIQRVPALVLKQTEQARGQPLAGAAVPVTNELFWIALSDDADQASKNIQLLREGSWFDIPILFSDQTRALISFEKGIPGDKVFETVMASWTPT